MSKRIQFDVSEADHASMLDLADKFGYKRRKFYQTLIIHGLEAFQQMDEQAKDDSIREVFDALKPDFNLLNVKK
jgi:hypothetical protein